ncbi:MAG: putative glutathione S-transferase [Flavobacteriales bacterium]|jgi:putative glutathione S-transferase
MGKLVDGKWLNDQELRAFEQQQYKDANGRFQRGTSIFRNWITVDGRAGISGDAGFKAEPNRYHIFAAINCPWAHRTLIYRQVKNLAPIIGLSLVAPLRTDDGWVFKSGDDRFSDELYQLRTMHEIYSKAVPQYTGRVTVPVLWDKQQQKIVSNESSEIIRMFNSAFNHVTGDDQDFYPDALAAEIDELNDLIYNNINNGVYKAGFARTQEAYVEPVTKVFSTLDSLEAQLSSRRYLLGDNITEADWRLLPTLVRFDVGYFSAFKCNLRAIRDYPHLSAYLQDLYSQPSVASTVDLDIYRAGYHSKSPLRNPHGIVPVGFENVLN